MPAYQSVRAAGMDVRAAVKSTIQLEPGRIVLVPSGFAIALLPGYEAHLRPRSGFATKYGVTLVNSPGTVDADHRGEVGALINLGTDVFEITRGLRTAQMIIARVNRAEWHEVQELPSTSRDSGGFGHTGSG